MIRRNLAASSICLLTLLAGSAGSAEEAAPLATFPVTVAIDAAAGRHAISPLIYGVNFGTAETMNALNATFNRFGGNTTSTYNWLQNAWNLGVDWFFESYPAGGATPGANADSFIAATRQAHAQTMITVPMIGRVAKLGANRKILPSFSIAKYGAQASHDPYFPDAGDGVRPGGALVAGNNPNDSTILDSSTREQGWLRHLVAKWGRAAAGGVRYYGTDNEPSLWYDTHRDISPVGLHAAKFRDLVIDYSAKIKAIDPGALILGPEEWGWMGFLYSGFDHQTYDRNGTLPDFHGIQGGRSYVPWLLSEWKRAGRAIDGLSLHYYPQSGEFGDDVSPQIQRLRNRSTREFWDRNYRSESWIDAPVYLIPRMRAWVNQFYYPGTKLAITEYNWGAENHINGATAQADILGIFGREGLDIAARWGVPPRYSPTFKAMQMYRNYDGHKSAFGDVSVSTRAPSPDRLSAFAALRSGSGAMTVMVVNKDLGAAATMTMTLAHFRSAGTAEVYQLTAANAIKRLANRSYGAGKLSATLPAQSITLFVLPNP